MSLPLLPGMTFNSNIGKTSFNKPQRFGFSNKIATELDPSARNPKLRSCATEAVRPKLNEPAWKAFDKCVLCFHAFFRDTIVGVSQIEKYRYRRCKIFYFLEDDTMQIVEPTQRNSGIPQGTTIRRHRFKKPESLVDGEFYTLNDLNVDITLEIYGQFYKITDCDVFTRQFLSEIGITVNDPVSEPTDPYTQQRHLLDDTSASRKPYPKKDKLGQFLNFNPKVLRFYCLWDDTINLFGAKRKMKLHYILEDDTVEVMEDREVNSGRSDTKVLLKRAPLPKNLERLPNPGEMSDRTMLNISGVRGNAYHYAIDNHPVPEREVDYYKDSDFDIGKLIDVWGRPFLIYDCDEFTKSYYKLKYNKDLIPMDLPKEVKPISKREIPADNWFGSPDDSIENCKRLVPKPARKDITKFLLNDKYGFDSKQLTFVASILSDHPITKSRKFVITWFLSDDTMQINEPYEENTGIMNGMKVTRTKVKKPESDKSPVPLYYTPSDLYVGAILRVRGNDYQLSHACEYTLTYMEKNPQQFIYSDIMKIIKKVRPYITEKCALLNLFFRSVDPKGTGSVSFDVFRETIRDNVTEELQEQELITLGRHYAKLEDFCFDWNEVIAMAQTELRKKNYNDFDNLSLALRQFDTTKSGSFSKEKMYIHLKSCRLPLADDVIKAILYRFPGCTNDQIKYSVILNALNYFENPLPVAAPIAGALDINWKKITTVRSLDKINYVKFIQDMEPNYK